MKALIVSAVVLALASVGAIAAWDPGGNTPTDSQKLRFNASQPVPLEPRTCTTRDCFVTVPSNGGG